MFSKRNIIWLLSITLRIPRTFAETYTSFADKFQIRGALSKSFHDLTNLHIYFEQAKNLDDRAKLSPDNHIFVNDDYGIYSIISRIVEGHSIFELCHEGVLRLYRNGPGKWYRLYQHAVPVPVQ